MALRFRTHQAMSRALGTPRSPATQPTPRRKQSATGIARAPLPGPTVFAITPCAKPRMTRRDRWAKRPCVLAYRAFCDALALAIGPYRLPDRYRVIFVMPMPRSWSGVQRERMRGKPHQCRPDRDNLEKSLLDGLKADDSRHWDGHPMKLWGETGCIALFPVADDAPLFGDPEESQLIARLVAGEIANPTGESART